MPGCGDEAHDEQRAPFAPGSPSRTGPAPRVLIYSHDTFGLGHLRRSRAIANALVGRDGSMSVIIVSGSPVIGSFEFGDGVDYVRVPGVIKLPDGDYTTLNLHMPVDEAVALREAHHPADGARRSSPTSSSSTRSRPGFRGEILPTLRAAEGARRAASCSASAT